MRFLAPMLCPLVLGCLLGFGACSPATPNTHYECTCQVTCDSVRTSWNGAVCETEGSEDVAAEDARSLCLRDQTSCPSPSCSCSCHASGSC